MGGGNHSLFEGGKFGVGHIAEPLRDRIGRKMQIQGLRRAAVATVQKRRRGVVRVGAVYLVLVNSTKVSTAKPVYLRASTTRLGIGRRIRSRQVGSVFPRQYWRVFRPAARVCTATFYKPPLAGSVTTHLKGLLCVI